jgi:glyoxylase I family protein
MHNDQSAGSSAESKPTRISGLWGVRYQVRDVRRAVEFYTNTLGFELDHQNLPAFGQVLSASSSSFSVGPVHPARGQCRTGVSRSPGAGTGSSSA